MYRYSVIILVLLFVLFNANVTDGKSLYVVDHVNRYLTAFDIANGQLIFQNQITMPIHGHGPVDITTDDESKILFISYERNSDLLLEKGGNIIELYSATSLEHVKKLTVGHSGLDLTGLAFDYNRSKLYVTNRNTNELHVFDWNPYHFTLTPDPNSPILLEGIDYACGLTIGNDVLYVSEYEYIVYQEGNFYNNVYAYDPNNNFALISPIDMGNAAVGIAYSSTDDALYAGAFRSNSEHLIKRQFDPNSTIEKDINAHVTAVVTDDDLADMVFATGYYKWFDSSMGAYRYDFSIKVWDTSGWPTDPIDPPFIYNSSSGDQVTISNLSGLTIGGPYLPPSMSITITDPSANDPNNPSYNVGPNDNITYTIRCLPDANDHTNVKIVAQLPPELEFISANPSDGQQDWIRNTYTWDIGAISSNDPNDPNIIRELTVQVNDFADPLGQITAKAYIQSDTSHTYDYENTPVSCWYQGDIIYVNQSATGYNNGTSWSDAYVDLQTALTRAAQGCGNEIWVAKGTYTPGPESGDVFLITDGIKVYGGFSDGDPNRLELRNFLNNKTYLHGNVTCNTVVKIDDAGDTNDTTLDGFIVTHATNKGIYCYNCGNKTVIANCVVTDSGGRGIYCSGSDVVIIDCVVKDNNFIGIEFLGVHKSPLVERCNIYDNAGSGISSASHPIVRDCLIHHNGYGGSGGKGISIYSQNSTSIIRNNTIVYNYDEGIFAGGTDPNVTNCILWYNNSGDPNDHNQLTGCSAYYSCVSDPNDPNGTDPNAGDPDDNYNISSYPNFAYSDPDLYNYHLDPNSACIDMGDPGTVLEMNETDIDGDPNFGIIDMGADEYTCSDVFNDLDWDADGIIGIRQYADISAAWLTDPNDPNNWNPLCDLDDDDDVDVVDLVSFCDHWLWQACWANGDTWMMMSMGSDAGGFESALASASSTLALQDIQAAKLAKWQSTRPPYQPTIKEQITQLEDILVWLDETWDESETISETIGEKNWQDFVDAVKEELNILLE